MDEPGERAADGLLDTVAAIARRDVGAVELTEAVLARIGRLDARSHAFLTLLPERALARARAVDAALAAGEPVGPLAGAPVAVKDIFDIESVPTTAGMALRREHRATTTATVVERLEAAGAIVLGKLALTEGVYAEHRPPFPVPVNPWDTGAWPGASSSGSGVAVAAGLVGAALGSETGGSIKLPAAVNGVTACKPTWGRVSRHGVFELAATLDHVGPMARSAADAAALLGAIAGPDPRDPTAAQVPVPDYLERLADGAAGLRIGVDPVWLADDVDAGTVAALEAAVRVLETQGASVHEVRVPDVTQMIADWFPVCAVQTARAHADTFPAERDAYGPALAELLDLGRGLTGMDVQELTLRRLDFAGRLDAVLAEVDALALPVLAFPVPSLERMQNVDDALISGLHRFTCPFNLSGHPGVVMPCGADARGLPIVFQLVGRRFEEARLLAAAHAFQQADDSHRRRPPR